MPNSTRPGGKWQVFQTFLKFEFRGFVGHDAANGQRIQLFQRGISVGQHVGHLCCRQGAGPGMDIGQQEHPAHRGLHPARLGRRAQGQRDPGKGPRPGRPGQRSDDPTIRICTCPSLLCSPEWLASRAMASSSFPVSLAWAKPSCSASRVSMRTCPAPSISDRPSTTGGMVLRSMHQLRSTSGLRSIRRYTVSGRENAAATAARHGAGPSCRSGRYPAR